ncbi:hypothetical protein PUN28_005217 [Cardiocondyla obscurior]|uniref:Uncharacterized protein n=1 Tax=Cardiocondyla obscurior TaxID=286306 RepID=A0AAW2GJQ1_9HYME
MYQVDKVNKCLDNSLRKTSSSRASSRCSPMRLVERFRSDRISFPAAAASSASFLAPVASRATYTYAAGCSSLLRFSADSFVKQRTSHITLGIGRRGARSTQLYVARPRPRFAPSIADRKSPVRTRRARISFFRRGRGTTEHPSSSLSPSS